MAHVLVVDDHEDSREVAATMLRLAGHAPVFAADGDEALAVLKREPIDLALIDIFMPVKDGITLIREMRRDHPRVKIVAVSAGARQVDFGVLKEARALGADGALPKPLHREALLTLVEGLT